MPVTRYAKSSALNIAYQVVGTGPRDLVYVPGWISNVEVMWEEPTMARFLRRLARFSRLILFDKRGTGLSDPVPLDEMPILEERMDDLRAVMDTVGSERATLLGHSEGGNMCILFAASYPQRVERVVLAGCYAKRIPSPGYPWAPDVESRAAAIEETERTFGDPDALPDWIAPSRTSDPAFREWYARYMRLSSSPRAAAHLLAMNTQIDTTSVLPSVQAPTLCLYRIGDRDVNVEEGRWIADRLPHSTFVEIPGTDHLLNAEGADLMLAEIEQFVTGRQGEVDPERTLATILFTDIVGSTEFAARLGDRAWRDVLERHNDAVRAEVERLRGRVVGTQGDGFLAIFDGPARAIEAGQAIVGVVEPLGLEVRAGVHTGEIELVDDDVAGLAVHIGARVAALAEAGEVLVSRTVRDLVAGSRIEFVDRGRHVLKGVPDEWNVYAVAPRHALADRGSSA